MAALTAKANLEEAGERSSILSLAHHVNLLETIVLIGVISGSKCVTELESTRKWKNSESWDFSLSSSFVSEI